MVAKATPVYDSGAVGDWSGLRADRAKGSGAAPGRRALPSQTDDQWIRMHIRLL